MTLMKIEDFKCRPSICEYLVLYLATSGFIVIASSALLGHISMAWAWLSFTGLLLSAALLHFLKHVRNKRAVLFYNEWLNALEPHEVNILKHRLKTKCPEQHVISQRLNQS